MEHVSVNLDGRFDVRRAVDAFIQDCNIIAFEFPPYLTSDERNFAKEIVGQHPDLRCETYGFGMHRKLHVFKSENKRPIKKPVQVNTLINDCTSKESYDDAIGKIFSRSTHAVVNSAEICRRRGSCDQESSPSVSTRGTADSPRSSMSGHSDYGSLASNFPDLPAYIHLPENLDGLPVRNTFIHFRSPAEEQIAVSVSNSLPHDMKFKFGELLAVEASERAHQYPSDVSDDSDRDMPLRVDLLESFDSCVNRSMCRSPSRAVAADLSL